MFAVKVAPLTGESFTSWIARISHANALGGRVLLRLASDGRVSPDANPDAGIGVDAASLISARVDVSVDSLVETTLRGHADLTLGVSGVHAIVLPLSGRGRKETRKGYLYCPACLAEDVPHFRLHWRLAVHTCCPRHRQLMMERCPRCQHVIELLRIADPELPVALHRCGRCRYDLRRAKPAPVNGDSDGEIVLLQFLASLDAGGFAVGGRPLPLIGAYYTGLRALISFLASKRADKLWAAAGVPASRFSSNLRFEWHPLEYRHQLLTRALELTVDWPHRFIRSAFAAGVTSAEILAEQERPLPFWYEGPLLNTLSKRRYAASDGEIKTVLDRLAAEGAPLYKVRVKRLMGISESKSLDRALGVRRKFSAVEAASFVGWVFEDAQSRPCARDERRMALRDALILYLSATSGDSLETVCAAKRPYVTATLRRAKDHVPDALQARARLAWAQLDRAMDGEEVQIASAFQGRYGGPIAGTTVRTRVTAWLKTWSSNLPFCSANVVRGALHDRSGVSDAGLSSVSPEI